MVKLLVPSFPNSKAFFTLFSSLGFRSITTTPTTAASIKKLAFSYRFNIARASSSSTQIQMNSEKYTFGPYKIDSKEVFCSTDLSYAMVNLRPLLPGHILSSQFQDDMLDLLDVLVCPRREVKRFVDLTTDETSDLWIMAQKVGCQLEHHHKASSLTFAIQDGPQAGQTVPHVHIHIIPRKSGDFENNDEIYEAIDEKEKELKAKLDLDKERKDRTLEEMAMEADEYRKLLL